MSWFDPGWTPAADDFAPDCRGCGDMCAVTSTEDMLCDVCRGRCPDGRCGECPACDAAEDAAGND